MTKKELAKAFQIAKSDTVIPEDNLHLFNGFGLDDFKPVYCTLRDVAKLIRYQCQFLTGGWDMDAFQDIAFHSKKRFIIIG
jgi:hypothetical protein